MGTTANALELSYSSRDQIPRILEGFASYCVAAATVDPKYCPLAAESMKFKDPVSDVIGRVRRIIANLTMRAGVPATAHPELADLAEVVETAAYQPGAIDKGLLDRIMAWRRQ